MYDSISGEELDPYRRLSAGEIQTIVGGKRRYRALIHKRIPVHSVGIEILPAYYEEFLKRQYPDLALALPAAFRSVDQAVDFTAMSRLLFKIERYRGEGAAADLFYEAKVTEAVALTVDAWKQRGRQRERPLSAEDAQSLQNAVSYIADHCAASIPLEQLAAIACMSESKLKGCFRRQFGCSVTQYIQGRRMSQAEHLLVHTDLTMGQIARTIGYTTSSRFAELFRKSTGILPVEYRKLSRRA
ncbi:AraC family transcriptional regulator [uncultured Oscillibacter sp.]|uniref:AraC family transcriptional regulator n=1 Tax=uncultured Oscillibacter sp. TaxID=876091 RepID=UPI0025E83ADF|nr:AraC family transcriptional regulator [uncultured Oscillibacter sp.]